MEPHERSMASRTIADLRERRVHAPRNSSLHDTFVAAARELARARKRLTGVARAWETVCPAGLVDRTAIDGVNRGVLTIRVSDASTRFELDRLLRSGGEDRLVRVAPTTVRKVRLVIGRV